MPSSLGIYIENNLIKYAKVVKEKDSIKVEAFNVVFYENNLSDVLNKVISETYSFKTPICINVSNELYNYYDVFAMLNKNDIKKSIDIEFEMLCNEKNYNRNSLETRYVLMNNKEDNEKLKTLHIAVNKTDINKKTQAFGNVRVSSMTPISTSITNLVDVNPKENIAIINIEDETKITTIVDGQISRVDTIEYGMGQILDNINRTENSMQKSYDVCKNITIYTQETQALQSDENEHLEDVMPTLYKIATESKKIIDSSLANLSRVYITGLGTAINNIDLYFQEYMVSVKCEILKPYFVESSSVKISVKDYIEVNSAIALAMNGIGFENKELNFMSGKALSGGNLDLKVLTSNLFAGGLTGPLDIVEKMLIRLTAVALMGTAVYIGFSMSTMKQIEAKTDEINSAISVARGEISKIDSEYSTISGRTSSYTSLINSVNNLTDSSDDMTQARIVPVKAVPNLLERIMFVIPQKVQITSIDNTQGTHITIQAQSEKYEQLGYFKAMLASKGILTDVKSTSGMKDGGVVKVTIEGDLP